MLGEDVGVQKHGYKALPVGPLYTPMGIEVLSFSCNGKISSPICLQNSYMALLGVSTLPDATNEVSKM